MTLLRLCRDIFLVAICMVSMTEAYAGQLTIDIDPAYLASNDQEEAGALDYDWVFLKCLHDSEINRECPQIARAGGYNWYKIEATCGRSYWGCYGSF